MHPTTVAPTESFLEIISIGTESTCVHSIECELLWVYRGDPDACTELEVKIEDRSGNLVDTETTENDGQQMKLVDGDADVNEYTLTLTCLDDSDLTDSIDLEVSYTPAPT